jgi:hypothetical protein
VKILHGSEKSIIQPRFGVGNPANDYGLGFYCTEDWDAAKLWACKDRGAGFINRYEFNPGPLRQLDLTGTDEKSVLEWLTLLVFHRFSYEEKQRYQETIALLKRTFPVDLSNVDYVIGYRADDAYFSYSRDFLANSLPFELLVQAMSLGKLGKQIALLSPRSFQEIHCLASTPFQSETLYPTFRSETTAAYQALRQKARVSMTYLNELLKRYSHD